MTTAFDLELAEPVHGDWLAARAGLNGLSVAATLTDGEMTFWGPEDIEALADHLECSDLLVTFAGRSFDLPVVSGLLGRPLYPKAHFDIQAEIRGLVPHTPGWTLDAICKRTIGKGKNSSGAAAPLLYRLGDIDALKRYLANDVELTQELYDHIVAHGYVIGPDGQKLDIGTS